MAASTPSFLQDVEACLGPQVAAYAANKRRGGDSGKKGARYEDFYAAACLAEIAHRSMITTGPADWPHLEEQADALVDDLVIRRAGSTDYHQCKNVDSLSWSGGRHPLQDDFLYQARVARYQGVTTPRTLLVVSNPALAATLKTTLPSPIASHSDVIAFPCCGGSLNRLVLEHAPLKASLSALARTENPDDDDIACVFGALLIGIRRLDGSGPSALMFCAAQSAVPQLIRLLPSQMNAFAFEPGFQAVIDQIAGLRYGVERGFFHWQGFGTSRVLAFNCLTPDFVAYQQRIVRHAPRTFDAFETIA